MPSVSSCSILCLIDWAAVGLRPCPSGEGRLPERWSLCRIHEGIDSRGAGWLLTCSREHRPGVWRQCESWEFLISNHWFGLCCFIIILCSIRIFFFFFFESAIEPHSPSQD